MPSGTYGDLFDVFNVSYFCFSALFDSIVLKMTFKYKFISRMRGGVTS